MKKSGYGPSLIRRRCPTDEKVVGVSLLGLIKSLFPWDKTSLANFRQNFEKGEIAECGPSLYSTLFCPVYELHAPIDVVAKSHTHCESHCNKWDPLCHHRCFNKAF